VVLVQHEGGRCFSLFDENNISMVSLLVRFTVLGQCVWYPATVYAQPLGRATRYLFRLYVRHWSDVRVIVRYVYVVVYLWRVGSGVLEVRWCVYGARLPVQQAPLGNLEQSVTPWPRG